MIAYKQHLIDTDGQTIKIFNNFDYEVHSAFNQTFDMLPFKIFCKHKRIFTLASASMIYQNGTSENVASLELLKSAHNVTITY